MAATDRAADSAPRRRVRHTAGRMRLRCVKKEEYMMYDPVYGELSERPTNPEGQGAEP